MEKHNFKVGQLAEMRTFEDGFRGAWFRCKITDIQLKSNMILLEYIDFELEDPSWVKIYQMPPYGRKSKHIKKQLMVRPQYPVIYHKDKMPPVNSISQACVVIDDTWKVGNMVDWLKDDCHWTARIVKVLSDDKVQIELPMPPVGQGKEGEDGKLEAFCKDLRPSLDWSETKGWTFHIVEGQSLCDAQLIFPTKQVSVSGMDLTAADGALNSSSSCSGLPAAEGDRESEQNVHVRMDSDSVSSLRVEAAADEVEKRELNMMHQETLEAAVLDLEELINKVNWMQRILHSPATSSSWKFP